MGSFSKIEWTDATWTPIRARNLETGKTGWHCQHVSPGCEHCYSETLNRRIGSGLAFKPGHIKDVDVFLDAKMLAAPLRWRAPRRIFVCSMTDLFGEWVPDEWIDDIFAVMISQPQHQFQVLTKRPERMRRYVHRLYEALALADEELKCPAPNIWLGVSVENQARADERIPLLLETPAAVRFISAEPLLGPLDLLHRESCGDCDPCYGGRPDQCAVGSYFVGLLGGLSWVIVGGESGPGKRPVDLAWLRSIRDQCLAAGVPLFVKQIDKRIPIPDDLMIRQWPKGIEQ